jgi:hypothetical protein
MKYFYIICRDGQILEIPFSEDSYKNATAELVKKGLLAIRPKGAKNVVIINSVDVTKILDEDNYEDYISSTNPNLYIKDGTWRDSKERKVVRYEKWKQEEIDSRQKLNSGDNEELSLKEQEEVLIAIPRVRKMLEEKGILKSVDK